MTPAEVQALLLGKTIEEAHEHVKATDVKINGKTPTIRDMSPGRVGTMDYVPTRINVELDDAKRIVKVISLS